MASINEILGKNIESVKALKQEIKALQDSLIGLDTESKEFQDTSLKLSAAQAEYVKVTKASQVENNAAKDSLVGMRQEYKNLYDQYKLLSDEQRNSDFGKNMASSLESLSEKINETQKGIGDYRGNIGRYAESVTQAFSTMGVSVGGLAGPLKLANGGFQTLNKTMLANPVGIIAAAIAAIIAIFKKMKEAVGENEELQMRYNEAMAKFQPIIDAVKNGINTLAEGFVKYIEVLSKAFQKIREFGAGLTDFLGITKGAKKELQEQQAIYDDIAKSTNELTKAKRENQKLNSEDSAEVQRLRELASETENREEKQKLLTQAKEKQAEIDQRNIQIAQDELRVLEEQAALTANDAEMNDRLAAAVARVSDAQATAANNARAFNKQINATPTSTTHATTATKNYREEAKKLYEDLIEDSKDEVTKLTEKYQKEKKLLEKYHYDTRLLTEKYNNDILELQKQDAEKVKEAIAARREKILNGYEQERTDFERHLALLRTMGQDGMADIISANRIGDEIIPAVQAFADEVNAVLDSAVDDNMREDLIKAFNTEGFEAFPGLKEKIDEINSKYGTTITTLDNLKTTIGELNEEQKTLLGESQMGKISKAIDESTALQYEMAFEKIKELGTGAMSQLETIMIEGEYHRLEMEKTMLEEELANFQGTQEQKAELLKRYYEVSEELSTRQNELNTLNQETTLQMVENITGAINDVGNALGTIKSSYESMIDSEVKAGKMDEKTANEKKKRMAKLEIAQKAFSIATIAADAASGIFSIWKGYATETGQINPQTAAAAGLGAGPALAALNIKSLVSAIAKTTSLAATATAQIAAARSGIVSAANSMQTSESDSGPGVSVTPVVAESTPYQYARTVQTQEDEDYLNERPIIVRVSDIMDGIDTHNVQVSESSF